MYGIQFIVRKNTPVPFLRVAKGQEKNRVDITRVMKDEMAMAIAMVTAMEIAVKCDEMIRKRGRMSVISKIISIDEWVTRTKRTVYEKRGNIRLGVQV